MWLAIHLPCLPLEALAVDANAAQPLAVSDRLRGQQRIVLCNPAAAAAGVVPGMKPGAARALAGALQVMARDERRELSALEGLAIWSGGFSSQVALAPPASLLLELAGSRRLFGGLDRLLSQVRAGLAVQRYRFQLATAPTPEGARVLAMDGQEKVVAELPGLEQALRPLSLSRLPLTPEQQEEVRGIGVRTLGDLLCLPVADLGDRLGREFMNYLQRLLGQAPDPRALFQPPPYFRRRLELPAEVGEATALQFACRRLLFELAGYLTARQAGTQRLQWRLGHAQGADSRFTLGLLGLERDPQRMQLLLGARLERLELPAPVTEIELAVDDLRPLAAANRSLFRDRTQQVDQEQQLLARLQARLGEDAVYGIEQLPDHRPERAWRRRGLPLNSPSAMERAVVAGGERPLWLLPEPQPLAVRDGWPWLGGWLRLAPERERIDTGWWDGKPVARDYFVASSPAGRRYWIYRDIRGDRGWYLHGVF